MPDRPAAGSAPIEGPVRILFVDVDGTLTDGVIVYDAAGRDARHFWVHDGLSLEWARDNGVLPVVISGRGSDAVAARMKDLGLEHYLGCKDKVAQAEKVLAREFAQWKECAMIGDDLPDVPLMKRVGWPVAVANARPEVIACARTVTVAAGGFGAVREAVEAILRHNRVWGRVLERYEAG
jgi:3-deoxy-D-manno-octulosonate 8-phosphate phosphatase (KDO 8-P phosphatase)